MIDRRTLGTIACMTAPRVAACAWAGITASEGTMTSKTTTTTKTV